MHAGTGFKSGDAILVGRHWRFHTLVGERLLASSVLPRRVATGAQLQGPIGLQRAGGEGAGSAPASTQPDDEVQLSDHLLSSSLSMILNMSLSLCAHVHNVCFADASHATVLT